MFLSIAIKHRSFAYTQINEQTEASLSDCLMSYPGYWLHKSAEMQSMYSAAPADKAILKGW